ncbi:hypothetical protein Hanom_Chr06g00550271 [Helianthus anomalus]
MARVGSVSGSHLVRFDVRVNSVKLSRPGQHAVKCGQDSQRVNSQQIRFVVRVESVKPSQLGQLSQATRHFDMKTWYKLTARLFCYFYSFSYVINELSNRIIKIINYKIFGFVYYFVFIN